MRKWIIYILLVICGLEAFCQENKKMLSVKDMKKDVENLYYNLISTHPNPYAILTPEEFDVKIKNIENRLTEPKTQEEFYDILSSINRYLDRHTQVYPTEKMLAKMRTRINIPKIVEKENKVYFFYKDTIRKDDTLKEIITINGQSIDAIKCYYAKKDNILEPMNDVTMKEKIICYYTYNHITDSLLFKYKNNDNSIDSIYFFKDTTKTKSKTEKNYNLIYDSILSVAVMEINTFYPKTIKESLCYKDDIDSYFDTLNMKKIKKLYVDITCNSGGYFSLEEWFLSHFIDDTVTRFAGDFVMKRSYQRKKQRSILFAKTDGSFKEKQHYFIAQKQKNKFKGEVFVVQSRYSFSAASTFSSQFQAYNIGKVIGEESQVKACYTDPIQIRLKYSQFTFTCATQYLINVGKEKNKGTIPDIYYKIENPFKHFSIEELEKIDK
jgi:hypothetical protein